MPFRKAVSWMMALSTSVGYASRQTTSRQDVVHSKGSSLLQSIKLQASGLYQLNCNPSLGLSLALGERRNLWIKAHLLTLSRYGD